MDKVKDNKLSLLALIAMCVGSMIGAGLFALPQNVACKAGVPALLIAWLVTFLGMWCLATVFQNLSWRCADLDTGIYSYAKAVGGDYFGFSSAWGYWSSVWTGNIGYIIMICAALSLFSPLFGDGTTWLSLIVSSIIIWIVTFLCWRGIKTAALLNITITVIKIIPIIVFIIVAAYAFKPQIFTTNIAYANQLGPMMLQIKNMMLLTVWVFIGIEGANVFSAKARYRKDIGRATIISFFVIFFVLFTISFLPFGILPQAQLAILKDPAIGGVLASVVGVWGNVFVNIALIVAILGAFLSWVLIAAEVPYVAGKKDSLFPRIFTLENKFNFPAGALVVTAICEQIYLIFIHYFHIGYLEAVLLAVTMILPPYLFAAGYALILAVLGKTYEQDPQVVRSRDLLVSAIAVLYGIWLLYAAGKYLLLSSLLYFIGGIVFIVNKKIRQQKIFNQYELILFLFFGVLSIISVYFLLTGKVSFK